MGRVAAVVAGLLLALPLAGCGEPTTEDYCAQLRLDREQLSAMVSASSPTALLDNLELLQGLGEKAPSDLTDEWQTFLGALEDLDRALRSADVSAEDFQGGEPPAGLSPSERRDVVAAADQIRSEEVVSAASGIEQQGRDVCKVNLGL
ncbi:hypothetical protein [Nocardioides aurantiacus]|uniref:Uncharacterized protein n=1 Tax=Nocardioides aurantiacus TaxID=86796 RepID=A0A3N2CUM4_9ACTN|nr:hypothetical protein [Nocardioides aurantiacus]ROR91250.1 hypothetical protein EDD33_2116 [Nocardioides aurantiacus]